MSNNLKEKTIDVISSSFEDWLFKRQSELEDFLIVTKNSDEVDIEKLKKVILQFPLNFSFVISEKAFFKKKLKEWVNLYEEKNAMYIAKALAENQIKSSDAKYKQEQWLKANTDIAIFQDNIDRYQAVVDYLDDCISLFKKMPIFEFNSLLNLEQKLS